MLTFLAMGTLAMITMVSCKKDDPEPEVKDPIASFQFEISQTNFLEVTFTNYSQNATSYSWDFGDGETSTEENPVYTYAEPGSYTVVLTAYNSADESATYDATIQITDPEEAYKLLTGEVSKTWKLYREGTSMSLGPDATNPAGWWSGLQNDGVRPCLYFQEFTFHFDGTYEFNDNGMFWGESGVFDGQWNFETCFEAIPANMINLDEVDVSAWLSGTHQFTYNTTAGTATLNGEGAWIGIPKLGTSGYTTVPLSSVTFNLEITEYTGYDLMTVTFFYGDDGLWTIVYANYSDPSLEPDVVSFRADFSYTIDGMTVTFENESNDAVSYSWDFGDGNTSTEENPVHTYDAEGIYDVTLTATNATGDTDEAIKSVSISLDPTELAPAPTEPEENVISIYSDTYTDITGVNLNPGWGQATVTSEIEVLGEMILKMAGLTYQGIDFAENAQDVSSKTKLHLDVYCSAVTSVNVSLISGGPLENAVTITTEAGMWKSIDIDLTNYNVPNLSDIIQLKFDDAGTGETPTIYVDNIYFY